MKRCVLFVGLLALSLAATPGTAQATPVVSSDLGITNTDGVTTAVPGTNVTYTITASNPGPNDDPAATIADTFPSVLNPVSWSCTGANGATCASGGSGNISDLANLPVGGSVTYTATGHVNEAATGSLSDTATVTSSNTDTNSSDNSAQDNDTLTPKVDLAVTKTDGKSSVDAGGGTTYVITASNSGPSDSQGASVTDTFPSGMTGGNWTCSGAGGGTCTAAGSGDIADTVSLPVGGSVTYTVGATVAGSAVGDITNTATAAAGTGETDPDPSNNQGTDTDTVNPSTAPTVTVVNPDGGESWARGTTHTIRWTYTNATGAHVRITLWQGVRVRTLVYRRSIGSAGAGSFVWTIPTDIPPNGGYRIRVATIDLSPNAGDRTDGTFTIT